jgi:HAD superfamily hydrolase (TIGR01509 family)
LRGNQSHLLHGWSFTPTVAVLTGDGSHFKEKAIMTTKTKPLAPTAIKAVLFDFDGTLTKPGRLDFPMMKKAIQCPLDEPLLEYIDTLPSEEEQKKALAVLDGFEIKAAAKSEPNLDAEALLLFLKSKGVSIGIISRNSLRSIQRALENFRHIKEDDFDVMVSRDTNVKPKPSGEGVRLAARKMNIDVTQVLVVGDYVFDIQAGHRAGAMTAFLENSVNTLSDDMPCHFRVKGMGALREVIRMRLPLYSGKLPNDLLELFLNRFSFEDPSVLIRPGIGEDTAAVDVSRHDVLILKSDPITFATDNVGYYSVIVNANDIATSGAVPRWFLTTLLLPAGITPLEVEHVMGKLHQVCRQSGITLCGGHTEITDAVSRTVITGMMAGTVKRRRLIDKRNIRPGDWVFLTKGAAVEGTAIIAREFPDRLQKLGFSRNEIDHGQNLLNDISILKEARIAATYPDTSAMHDVTEGGVATALRELSHAGGCRIRVDWDNIPVLPLTEKICRRLKLDPLGLIGSGSLLICCRKECGPDLESEIRKAGIPVNRIGRVLDPGVGVEAYKDSSQRPWPHFEVDEIVKLFS